jgi:hypothetical protein
MTPTWKIIIILIVMLVVAVTVGGVVAALGAATTTTTGTPTSSSALSSSPTLPSSQTTLNLLQTAKTRAEMEYAIQLLQWTNAVSTLQSNLTANPPDAGIVEFVIKQYDSATTTLEHAHPPSSAAAAHTLLLKKWLEGKADLLAMQEAIKSTPVGDYTPALLACLTATNEALTLAGDITGTL